MEEPTQMVDLPPGDERILTPPVGYIKVFAQKAVEEKNYCVAEGECALKPASQIYESYKQLVAWRTLTFTHGGESGYARK